MCRKISLPQSSTQGRGDGNVIWSVFYTANVRFQVKISQNRKWADKTSSKQFLYIKNCVKLLIYEYKQGTKSIRVRLRARETHMKPFVRTSFLGTRPSCLPFPGRPLFDTDDRKPILWLGRTGSPVIMNSKRQVMGKLGHVVQSRVCRLT